MARLLVADDDSSIREMIKIACELDGHDVRPAADAVEALEVYAEFRPDLMILDMNMPGGGGEFVIEQVRASDLGEPCPCIVVTGLAGALNDEERDALHAVEVLSKPFTLDGLRMAVKTALAG